MKIFKMIIIFMLCFLLVGCGEMSDEKKDKIILKVYEEEGYDKAVEKAFELYDDEEKEENVIYNLSSMKINEYFE